jgi:hypothetical protein
MVVLRWIGSAHIGERIASVLRLVCHFSCRGLEMNEANAVDEGGWRSEWQGSGVAEEESKSHSQGKLYTIEMV